MAPVLLLLVLLAEAASTSDQTVVVHPGDDVTLPCRADDSSIRAVEWSRPDLNPDTVLLYIDGFLETDHQNPSFKDRVNLVDRDLKDGDVSLTLKNVNINDAGTYECRVASGGSRQKKRDIINSEYIRIIRLQVTDLIVTVHPGGNATLPCRANDSSISAVEWSRPDLKPDTVLLYRDGNLDPSNQNPSFKDRVDLVDRDLKDGDVSLTLKNVNINDTGIYKCRFAPGGIQLLRETTVHLQLPGEKSSSSKYEKPVNVPKDGPSSPGGLHPGLVVGVVVVVVLVLGAAVAVAGFLMYKRQRRPGQRDAAAYEQPAEKTP